MSFDAFRPDDAGDETASYHIRRATSTRTRIIVTLSAAALVFIAGLVAVIAT